MDEQKVTEACHRIESLYYETHGKCYVSFSGGKDSTVLLALIKLCEEVYTIPPNAIPAVFSNTGIELGITTDFVKWVRDNWYSNVVLVRPEKSFQWVISNEGKPMISKLRSKLLHQLKTTCPPSSVSLLLRGQTLNGRRAEKSRLADKYMHVASNDFPIMPSDKCCEYMKKRTMHKYEQDNGMLGTATGLRMSEGGTRELSAKTRLLNGGKLCTYTKNGVLYKLPIIDWSDEDVDEFIEEYNVPLSKAYTEYGFDRTGCMACPFSKNIAHDLSYLYDHEPNSYKASMYWLKDVYIAQNVVLPFDEAYEREREREWRERYEPMRQEMLRKYRPNSKLIKDAEQMVLFDE